MNKILSYFSYIPLKYRSLEEILYIEVKENYTKEEMIKYD